MGKAFRLGLVIFCAVFFTLVASVVYTDWIRVYGGNGKENHARMLSQNIQKACKTYRAVTGVYPTRLSDLIRAEKPYLEGGERALIDPWGNTYQFVIVKDPNGTGDVFPVVFTISPQGRKIAWPREYGDI
jgi:hypothetical protein